MRHFDAWILRDPYSIWHYYATGRRWQETVRNMILSRQICAPQIDIDSDTDDAARKAVDPLARSLSSQPNCGLLQKLPPEIRLIIYGFVFGDEAVHLVQLKGKIRHVRCQNPSASISSHRHCCPETPARWRVSDGNSPSQGSMLYPHTHASLPEKLSNSSLSLLRTCRAIYLEAADMPYSKLAFDVDDLHTFVAFSYSISPEHLCRIKRLTIQWTPIWQPMTGEGSSSSIYSHTHNDQLWKLFWSRIQALTGLEKLYLSLDLGRFMGNGNAMHVLGGGSNKKISLDINEPWIEPMLSVCGLKDFDLCVTARCDASARTMLAQEIGRDAVLLRDHLRAVMCSPRFAASSIPSSSSSSFTYSTFPQRNCGQISALSCSEEAAATRTCVPSIRPRLMITAA